MNRAPTQRHATQRHATPRQVVKVIYKLTDAIDIARNIGVDGSLIRAALNEARRQYDTAVHHLRASDPEFKKAMDHHTNFGSGLFVP